MSTYQQDKAKYGISNYVLTYVNGIKREISVPTLIRAKKYAETDARLCGTTVLSVK